jgi:cytochrome o ubiquinol oxidase subunit 1
MLWTIGFMVTFTIGGMTGVLLAVPGADFVLHNSLFLIAHFHNVIIGGVLFGMFRRHELLVPEGVRLQAERAFWGKASFWCWLVGFYVAFMPLYVLGLMGMTRRMSHYANPAWQPWLIVAAVGALIIALGIGFMVLQLVVSVSQSRREPRPHGRSVGRPHAGVVDHSPRRSTTSPHCRSSHAGQRWADEGARQRATSAERYADIHMPRNTAVGVIMAAFGTVLGFAMIWHIWWLAIAALSAWSGRSFALLRHRRRLLRAGRRGRAHRKRTPSAISIMWGKRVSEGRHSPAIATLFGAIIGTSRTGRPRASRRRAATPCFGFWIYLMSDCLLFASLFATLPR